MALFNWTSDLHRLAESDASIALLLQTITSILSRPQPTPQPAPLPHSLLEDVHTLAVNSADMAISLRSISTSMQALVLDSNTLADGVTPELAILKQIESDVRSFVSGPSVVGVRIKPGTQVPR
jgi:hypothetical protein